ncbi:hypothetical protein UN64_19500 [Fictibacillus arsenicus]|uniref:Uncharacterized protein n=1 Tax=Fictibacillus arsenicus TaxID=255247 RepID=A0A1V3FZI7_9BACL|nr:hypothetical protein UN64_19500 [Fictibacillus arsenicus]
MGALVAPMFRFTRCYQVTSSKPHLDSDHVNGAVVRVLPWFFDGWRDASAFLPSLDEVSRDTDPTVLKQPGHERARLHGRKASHVVPLFVVELGGVAVDEFAGVAEGVGVPVVLVGGVGVVGELVEGAVEPCGDGVVCGECAEVEGDGGAVLVCGVGGGPGGGGGFAAGDEEEGVQVLLGERVHLGDEVVVAVPADPGVRCGPAAVEVAVVNIVFVWAHRRFISLRISRWARRRSARRACFGDLLRSGQSGPAGA